MLCLPGGGIEPGEQETEALVREMREELNLQVTPKKRCWRNKTSWGTDLAWWHATITDDQEPIANPEEVAEIFWMTKRQIQVSDQMLPSLPDFLVAMQQGQVDLTSEMTQSW